MTIGNSLLHDSEGENVLYADGHVSPTTMPYAYETRGTNAQTWNDNIFTVGTGPQSISSATEPATSPADDTGVILLPAR